MKDPFWQGTLASIIGIIAINIAELIMRAIKLSETTLWQAGGSIFLSDKALKTPLGITIGFASHIFVAMFVGIAIAYFLYFTGSAYAPLKGTALSLVVLFVTLGLIFPLRKLNVEMQNSPKDVLSAFIDHIIFGLLAGYIISYIKTKLTGNIEEKSPRYFTISKSVKEKIEERRTGLPFKKPIKIK